MPSLGSTHVRGVLGTCISPQLPLFGNAAADNSIFASTAASLASAATSGASTPTTVEPPKPTLSIAARSSREIARRKLYSGFFRSTPKSQQHTPKWESDETGESEVEAAVVEEVVATSPEKGLTEEVTPAETKKEDKIKKREEKEAEKKAKKAEKEAKRAEKEAKRAKKEAKRAKKSNPKPATESTPNELEPAELSTGPSVEGEAGESKEERRVRRDARRLEKAEKAAARDAKNAERGDKEARRTRRKEEEKMKEHKREGKKARKSNA